jgi:hypothetical protein
MSTIITGTVANGVVVPSAPLPEGAQVQVTVVSRAEDQRRVTMLDFLATLPPGPRAFDTWEKYEQHLRQENDAWER